MCILLLFLFLHVGHVDENQPNSRFVMMDGLVGWLVGWLIGWLGEPSSRFTVGIKKRLGRNAPKSGTHEQ